MLHKSPLGQTTEYTETYSPHLLFPVPRSLTRDKLGIGSTLPFKGIDIWNGYEISWLSSSGKPIVAMATFIFPCSSPHLIESKSFKLYLNSFNGSSFNSFDEVSQLMKNDLSCATQSDVDVHLFPPTELQLGEFSGLCLDDLEITTNTYQVESNFLKTAPHPVEETLYSNLLKSNCLATGQPDWGSVLIHYQGNQIDHEGLLKYIISFRNHAGFAEHCVEQMFHDIMMKCQPKKLSIYCRYTRRGGLDINPFRSTFEKTNPNIRQPRQ